jgi:phosphatidylserine/phosphatidylglycerophosphate/cardiolipin synthase-like enzyme
VSRDEYVLAFRASPTAFVALEKQLSKLPDDALIDMRLARSASASTSDEQWLLALRTLSQMGVLAAAGERWSFRKGMFDETSGFRAGVRAAFGSIDQAHSIEGVRLVSSFPSSLPAALRDALRIETTDLAAALFDLAASARVEMILAAPYWDADTIGELEPILVRRLEAGVVVRVLARSVSANAPSGAAVAGMRSRLGHFESFAAYSWYESDETDLWGSRTFHFKAAVADRGRRSYLGSANFTTSGLRSRFEIGAVLTGQHSEALYRILQIVLGIAEKH